MSRKEHITPPVEPSWLDVMAHNIKRVRLEMGLSQKGLARRAGVGINTVQNIEYGKSVQLSNLVSVCVALGMKPWQAFLENVDIATLEDVVNRAVEKKLEETLDRKIKEALAK